MGDLFVCIIATGIFFVELPLRPSSFRKRITQYFLYFVQTAFPDLGKLSFGMSDIFVEEERGQYFPELGSTF